MNTELIARLRSFETDHKTEGWPAIEMRDVSALLDAIETMEAEVERLQREVVNRNQRALDGDLAVKVHDAELLINDQLRAQLAAAQPVQVNAMLVEDVNSEIVKRYKVEKTKGGFWPYCVKAGDGTMDLFIGSKKHADHFQQALQSACLDGAFMAFTAAQQAQPALSGCACRWDADDKRVATCVRHQGWLDVVSEWAGRAKAAESEQAQPERAPLSDAELEQEFCNIAGLETGINPAAADTKRALVWFKKGYAHGIKQGGQ